MRRACVFAGCISGRRWEYHPLSGRCWEYEALSMHWLHHTFSAACWEYDTLSAIWVCYYEDNNVTGGYKKDNNQWYWWLPIYEFGQKRLKGGTNWSVAKDGQVLPHFQQIVSGASTLPQPMVAVI